MSKESPPELSAETERAVKCYGALLRATLSIRRDLSRQLGKFDLTAAQFGMMELLYRRGALTQRELAGELKVSDAEITHLVEALYRKDLAARKKRARDRRYILINLTSYGKWYMGHAEPSAVRIMARRLEALAAEEQEELIRLCGEIERERGEMTEEKEIDIERDYE